MYFTYYSSSPFAHPSSRSEYEPLVSVSPPGDRPQRPAHAKQFSFASLPLPVTQLAPSGFFNLEFAPSVAILLVLLCVALLSVRDVTVFHAVPPESVLLLTALCLLVPCARDILQYVSTQLHTTRTSPSSTSTRTSTQFIHYGFISIAFSLFLYALLSSAPVMPVSISATVLSLSAALALVLVTLLSSSVPRTFPVVPCLCLIPSALLVLLSMPASAVSAVPAVLLATVCLAVFVVLFATADALPACIGVTLFALSLVFADGAAVKACLSFSAVLCAAVVAIAINFVCRSAVTHASPLLLPATLGAAAPIAAAAAWPLFQEVPSPLAVAGFALHLCAAAALTLTLKTRCDHGDRDAMLCGLDVREKVYAKLGLVAGRGQAAKI